MLGGRGADPCSSPWYFKFHGRPIVSGKGVDAPQRFGGGENVRGNNLFQQALKLGVG
jgi:hypothetical protein